MQLGSAANTEPAEEGDKEQQEANLDEGLSDSEEAEDVRSLAVNPAEPAIQRGSNGLHERADPKQYKYVLGNEGGLGGPG